MFLHIYRLLQLIFPEDNFFLVKHDVFDSRLSIEHNWYRWISCDAFQYRYRSCYYPNQIEDSIMVDVPDCWRLWNTRNSSSNSSKALAVVGDRLLISQRTVLRHRLRSLQPRLEIMVVAMGIWRLRLVPAPKYPRRMSLWTCAIVWGFIELHPFLATEAIMFFRTRPKRAFRYVLCICLDFILNKNKK